MDRPLTETALWQEDCLGVVRRAAEPSLLRPPTAHDEGVPEWGGAARAVGGRKARPVAQTALTVRPAFLPRAHYARAVHS